jgi:hypothetical protein
MRRKALLIGTVVATVVMFAWQTISNVAIPWHNATMTKFKNNDAVVKAIHENAPENGVYFSNQGILATVAFTPTMADKSKEMGGMFGKQLVIDLITVLVLALFMTRLNVTGIVPTGIALAIAALAAGILVHASDWTWYGFSTSYMIVNTIDLMMGWFLTGLIFGGVRKKWPLNGGAVNYTR